MKNARKGNFKSARTVVNTRSRLPSIAAVGSACSLAAGGASAVELGEIQIQSSLGQPLRASIAYALNPNEQIASHCIFLKSGTSADGMPLLSRARVQVTDGAIILTGGAAIREPMLSMQLSVSCPGTANLAREYTLMFDPAAPGDGEAVAALPVATAPRRSAPRPAARREPVATAAAPAPATSSAANSAATPAASAPQVSERRSAPAPAATGQTSTSTSTASPTAVASAASNVDLSSVPTQSRYQVQSGDTLSEIVSRIDNRPPGLWRAVGHVFAANPHAFIDGDMNLIKAGSWLDIPDLYAAAGVAAAATPDIVAEVPTAAESRRTVAAETREDASTATGSGAAISTGFALQPDAQPEVQPETPTLAPAPQPEIAANTSAAETPEPNTNALQPALPQIAQPTESIRPAVVATGNDIPVSDAGTTGISAGTTPAVTTDLNTGQAGGRSWLFWLGGAGLALILGLLLFGRSMRARSGNSPSGLYEDESYDSYGDDADAGQQATATDLDATLIDETRMNRKLTLDADLGSGSGLQAHVNVGDSGALGYGDDVAASKDPSATDIVPALRVDDSMIVHREVPPDHSQHDDADDQSVIMDLQKPDSGEMKKGTPDRGGVEMPDANSETSVLQGLTLNEEIDLDALERDYEEEFTLTQNVNSEVARAAIEIAETLDNTGYRNEDLVEEVNEDISPDDMSGLTEALTEANLIGGDQTDMTAVMPADLSEGVDATDLTAAMPMDLSLEEMTDLTAAMPIDEASAKEYTDMTAALPADTLLGEELTDMTAALPADTMLGEELTDMTAALPADTLLGEDLGDMTAALPIDTLVREDLEVKIAALPAASQSGEDLTDLTAAIPSPSELDLDLGGELPPTDMTSPTAILPNDSIPGETAELTAHLPEASAAVNDDNIDNLDATGIIESPTAQMPNLDEDMDLNEDMMLDADDDAAAVDSKKEKKAG